jgi:hypothetical protein
LSDEFLIVAKGNAVLAWGHTCDFSERWWWTCELQRNPIEDDEEPFLPDCESLRRFIEQKVLPYLETRGKELSNRSLICEQAFGESLDPDKLERLARYEVHLDRKLERSLAMLFRLKELRPMAAES